MSDDELPLMPLPESIKGIWMREDSYNKLKAENSALKELLRKFVKADETTETCYELDLATKDLFIEAKQLTDAGEL